jgi:hypothetical protein
MKAARDPYKKVDNKRYKTKGKKQRQKTREQKREWE